jgi:hypothetical protein
MGQDAECYQKTVDDRTIILNVRSYYVQPFLAGDWTDLRLGFFLSLTDALNDDLTTGAFAETITGHLGPHDRYWIGAAVGEPGVGGLVHPRPPRPGQPPPPPTNPGGVFIGFTNTVERFPNLRGDSVLVSSDAGVGTTNTNFWRPANSSNDKWGAAIYDGIFPRAHITDNIQQHFPQNPATVAAGYAVLLAIQLLRDNADSNTITARIKSSTKSADWLYSNTPTKEAIQQAMETWPPSQQMGPVSLSQVPNAFYFYWPFRKTRLRVHSLSLLRGDL